MSIWTDLWNLFFPHSCLLCGRQLISGERVLCLKCLSGLPRTQFHLRKDNIVECNFWGKIPVEHATSFLYYAKGGNVRQLLYELKYHGNQEVGEVMGRMMASELMCSHFFDGIDLIVPVPLHQRKKRLRGYNQSECLARGVSVVTGIPMDTKVVIPSDFALFIFIGSLLITFSYLTQSHNRELRTFLIVLILFMATLGLLYNFSLFFLPEGDGIILGNPRLYYQIISLFN